MHFLKRVGAFLKPTGRQFAVRAAFQKSVSTLLLKAKHRFLLQARGPAALGNRWKRAVWFGPPIGLVCFVLCFFLIRPAQTQTNSLHFMMAQALATNGFTGYSALSRHVKKPVDAASAIRQYKGTNTATFAQAAAVAGAEAPVAPQSRGGSIRQENGYAIADFGPHHVQFAPNLNTLSAVNLQMINGEELRGNIVGVFYVNGATGQSVKLATLKDNQGEILSSNQVIYRSAFDGIKADVLFTYTGNSLEQDVVVRKQLPSPAQFNLNPATTRLMVMTEFLNPPEPAVRSNPLDLTEYNQAAGVQGESSLIDQVIIFKTMRMARGKAFTLGQAGGEIPVGKQWINVKGRHFLSESTPYPLIKQKLDALPPDSAKITPRSKGTLKSLMSEAPAHSPLKRTSQGFKMAENRLQEPGVVLDYLIASPPSVEY